MEIRILFLLLFFLLWIGPFKGQCQDIATYYKLVDEASRLYDRSEFLQSGEKYSEAFIANGNKALIIDRYNAACSWALAGQADSSFSQLFYLAQKGKGSAYIVADKDLNALHPDPRWNKLLEKIKANEKKDSAKYNEELAAILDTVYMNDQTPRLYMNSLVEKYGLDSVWGLEEVKTNMPKWRRLDSLNQVQVENIIDQYGWPGPAEVGDQGNQAIFLVIQHADILTQEKYLPIMREAVKNGNAHTWDLALLEDRVALREGEKQIYGSQVDYDKERQAYYVCPLEDPDHVDERRYKVGLPSIASYISDWKITWDIEQYKKDLSYLEALEKKKNQE